jgi:hypothetical protein
VKHFPFWEGLTGLNDEYILLRIHMGGKWMKRLIILLFLSTFLASCNQMIGCPDGAIEWVDLLKIDDVTYQHQFKDAPDEPLSAHIEKGEPVGKVTYKMMFNQSPYNCRVKNNHFVRFIQ